LKNGNKTLTMLYQVSTGQQTFIESLQSIEILGEHEKGANDYTFYDETTGRAKYAEVYSTDSYEINDVEGGTITISPPKMFGVFSDNQ